MSLHQIGPDRFVVQLFRADPLRKKQLRLCKRVLGREAAEKQERAFEQTAAAWVAQRQLAKQARANGLTVALPSEPHWLQDFPSYLESTYLPWAKTNLDPRTFETRSTYLAVLATDLAGVPLDNVENVAADLVARWHIEGCRYTATVDRLGRRLNRKPKPISDAGINERLKVLKAVLGHAHMISRVLPMRPRISMVTVKRAAPDASAPVRFFTDDERIRFLRYSAAGTDDVFQIGCMLGTRPDELFHLTVGSVDFASRRVLIGASKCPYCPAGKWVPKTGKFRQVDICDDLLPILRRLTKGRPAEALLIDSNHGLPYWRRRGGGGRFSRVLRRAGLDRTGLSIYSLRHTFASDLVSAGRSLQEVAALLGNSVRVCEMHYAHLRPGVTAETVKVLTAAQPWPAPANTTSGPARARKRAA
jgi:integrase